MQSMYLKNIKTIYFINRKKLLCAFLVADFLTMSKKE